MTYRINTTNQPVNDAGDVVDADGKKVFLEVDEAEYIDLQRLGLVKPGKGDVGDDGKLIKKLQKDASDAVLSAFPTGPIGTIPPAA